MSGYPNGKRRHSSPRSSSCSASSILPRTTMSPSWSAPTATPPPGAT